MKRTKPFTGSVAKPRLLYFLGMLTAMLNLNVMAQSLPECDATVPHFTVDLSEYPDSTYVSPLVTRDGQCCGEASNINFISFYATLHPNVAAVEIGIADGANPSGSGVYHFINGGDTTILGTCDTTAPAGQAVCIPPYIPGPNYKIAFGKPGNNSNTFFLRQVLKPTFPNDDSTRVGCILPVNIFGLENITISAINSSDGNTNLALYDSYLSCLDCSSPEFAPLAGAPDWIDYVIAGSQQVSTDCGTYQTMDTVRLYTFDALTASYAPNPAEICAGGSVEVTASASGGFGSFTIDWVDDQNDTLATAPSYIFDTQGSYTAKISDALFTSTCPSFNLPVSIIESQPPTVDAGENQILCATSPSAFLEGNSTNTTSILWSGGSGTFDPNNTTITTTYTPTAAEINAGSVKLYLESTGAGGGCINTMDSVVIRFSDTLKANPNYAPIACIDGTTTLHAGASGGILPYTYAWSTGTAAASIIASGGTYSVIVTDSIGCSVESAIQVIEPTALQLSLSSTNTSTDATCDGTASVVITGGTAPYTQVWSNGDLTLTADSLCYGIATVTVTDANGCTSTGSVVVNNPTCSGLQVTASNTHLECFGDADAEATAFVTGGTPPYLYSWNTSPVQTTPSVTNLSSGTYTVTVADDNGCIDIASVDVFQPSQITNTITHTDPSSIGGTDGDATANPAGGTPGYTYTWTPSGQTTQTATNLGADIYYVEILDANSCVKEDSVQINEPPCQNFKISVLTQNITCYGLTNGGATLIVSQGTAPYSIAWSSGEIDVTNVSGLAAGDYDVTITDAQGCTTFKTFNIAQPEQLSIALVPTNSVCFGDDNATIDLTVQGGVFPYTYNWTTGGSPVAQTQDLVLLSPNTYVIEVTDANGCTLEDSTGVEEPEKLVSTFDFGNITCRDSDDGFIDVTTTGGILPYGYSWTGPNGFTSNQEDVSSLDIGLYEVEITDGNGCTLGTKLQSFINEPDSVIIETIIIDCPVPGEATTLVTIDSISGGALGSYRVSFDNGNTYQAYGDYSAQLGVDASYNLYALDSNGCTTPLPTPIDIDSNVAIQDVSFDPCVPEGTTHINVTVTPTGGDGGPYEVSSDGGTTYNPAGNYVISLAVDNTYNIVIRDQNGCESTAWPITIAPPFIAKPTLTGEVSCPDESDGVVDLAISGGTTPYVISWTGPNGFTSAMEDLTGLVAGMYYVTVTDDSNCVVMDSVLVTTTPDVTPPTITYCPANLNISTNNDCYYMNSGTGLDATATDNCLVASIVYTLSGATTGSGTTLDGVNFNLDTTLVTWVITDGSGNTDTCYVEVIITDDTKPSIVNCGLGDQNVFTPNNDCIYTVGDDSWDAEAIDNCTVSSISYILTGATTGTGVSLSGVDFNLGTTFVKWIAVDTVGNLDSCTYEVSVFDNIDPTITCLTSNPAVVVDAGECNYTHTNNLWDAKAFDNCTVVSLTYELSGATIGSGDTLNGQEFNLGTTTVTWTAVDTAGNEVSCNYDVIVTDDQDPEITCLTTNPEVVADAGVCTFEQTTDAWDANADDNCSVVSLTFELTGATLGSGTTLLGQEFNLGTTTVTWTA
ncbi:HYR domain-containing protein, partial [Lishizhenia tianjinensis]